MRKRVTEIHKVFCALLKILRVSLCFSWSVFVK